MRLVPLLALALAAAGALGVGEASALPECAYDVDGKRVVVTVDGDNFVEVLRDGPEIQAKTESDVVDCGAATVLNTNEILFQGVVSNDPLPTLAIDETNGRFAPGAKREARGKSEIEFRMEVSQGTSGKVRVSVLGTSDAERITAGVLGLNLNGDGDLDVKTSAMPWLTDLVVNPAGGRDRVSGRGGVGTGAATAANIFVFGGAGADDIEGGLGDDSLNGVGGNDTFRAFDGDGSDLMFGGAGFDCADYGARTDALVITNDGFGGDGSVGENDGVFSDIEKVVGGSAADEIGGNGGDVLVGGEGSDTLSAQGGGNRLFGGGGPDTLTGGPGRDVIIGGARADDITGGAGRDELHGSRGNDSFTADDGFRDLVDGGRGADSAVVDGGLDTVRHVP